MKKIIVFGYSYNGVKCANLIKKAPQYELIGFADNSPYKNNNYAYGKKILNINELAKTAYYDKDIFVIIASHYYNEIKEQCQNYNIQIEGVYIDNRIKTYPFASFDTLNLVEGIHLYAGDIFDDERINDNTIFGLSITKNDDKHILHDIRKPYSLPDNCIEYYEAEDVFEYIYPEELPKVINEIYRVLKKGGWARFSMPDYNSDYLKNRSMTNKDGTILFDAGGGGSYGECGYEKGAQVYYPTFDSFSDILNKSMFKNIDWLCYRSKSGMLFRKEIDMNKGKISRLFVKNDDIYCMAVDCFK